MEEENENENENENSKDKEEEEEEEEDGEISVTLEKTVETPNNEDEEEGEEEDQLLREETSLSGGGGDTVDVDASVDDTRDMDEWNTDHGLSQHSESISTEVENEVEDEDEGEDEKKYEYEYEVGNNEGDLQRSVTPEQQLPSELQGELQGEHQGEFQGEFQGEIQSGTDTVELEKLKAVVKQSLQANGVLDEVRAKMRAAVFVTLDEQERANNGYQGISPPREDMVKRASIRRNEDTKLGAFLVEEYLEHYGLKKTLSVFKAESHSHHEHEKENELDKNDGNAKHYLDSDQYPGREALAAEFPYQVINDHENNYKNNHGQSDDPLLVKLVSKTRRRSNSVNTV